MKLLFWVPIEADWQVDARLCKICWLCS